MSVVACKETGNKVDGLATNDSVQVADTLFADRVVQKAEQNEEKENLALGGKGDLAAFDLHGNVKSCKWGGAIFTAYVTKGMLEKKKTASILNCLINKKIKYE